MTRKKAKPAAGARATPARKKAAQRPAAKHAVVRRRRATPKAPAKKKPPVKPVRSRPPKTAPVWDPTQPLENQHWERFCLLVADGRFSNTSCYAQVYPDSSRDAARSSAADLLANPNVRQRVEHHKKLLVASLQEATKVSLEEQVRWYLQVRDTPVGYIDEESPLAQEVTRKEVEFGGAQGQLKRGQEESGNEIETPKALLVETKIKIPDKLAASKQIDKLLGFEKPQEVNLNLGYEPPNKALERLVAKGIDVAGIVKKAGIGKKS